MRRDYKSCGDLYRPESKQPASRYGLIALFIASLCGSAIYFSSQTSTTAEEKSETQSEIIPLISEITNEAEFTGSKEALPQLKLVALKLPEKNLPTEQDTTQSQTAFKGGVIIPITNPPLTKIAALNIKESRAEKSTRSVEEAPSKQVAIAETPEASIKSKPIEPTLELPASIAITETQEIKKAAETPKDSWVETKVKNGDSLALIFSRLKLSPGLLHRIIHSSKEAKQLAKIRPGELIKVRQSADGEFLELVHIKSAIRSMCILAENNQFSTKIIDRDLEKRTAEASGTITSSLFTDAQRAGLSDSLVMELANIFGWDIDFALEIRAGDYFSLIYEEEYLDGKKFRNGPILAAEFVNRGKVFRAIRYEDKEGYGSYFSPDGNSMRKAFLRAPVDFRRISSRFTKARWHPVLGKKRPHKGVDYSARTGTMIKAAGDGRVIFRGKKGGYGRAIIIQHGQRYTTLYAHMSKYRGKVKKGSRVKQGQVIGYVGQSGLATGPHLHYEFRVNGVHRNPLTVKLPAAAPIAKKYRSDFKRKSSTLLSRLDSISNTIIAEAKAE